MKLYYTRGFDITNLSKLSVNLIIGNKTTFIDKNNMQIFKRSGIAHPIFNGSIQYNALKL